MEIENKIVRFDKWCYKCKHFANKFPKAGVSSEFQHPCGECLQPENAMRDGTEKPLYWEEP